MLKHVSIQKFRLFDQFSINNLARVNLIVGKNNVGKSSLLEALYLLVSQDTPDILFDLLETRGEKSLLSSETFRPDISHLFFGHRLHDGDSITIKSIATEPLGLTITFLRSLEQLPLFSPEEEQSRRSPALLRLEYQGADKKFDFGVLGEVLDRRRLRMFDTGLTQSNSNYITTKGFNYKTLAELWDVITLTPKENDIIKMLQILEPGVERISFQSRQTVNSGILIKREGQDYPLPLGSMGDGMHRILAIAVAMANSENGYLFIDEIDTGLHYRTITDMWNLVFKTAERLNIQVFATTHSSDGVESFAEAVNLQENRDIGKLFRLERRKEQIVAVEYTGADLTTAIRQDIEVR